jgi:putative lipase/esterase
MKIGTLLDTPQSAALIQQLLPELAQYVQQEPGSRGISVNDLQFYSNKMFDEEKLAALNEALVKLN